MFRLMADVFEVGFVVLGNVPCVEGQVLKVGQFSSAQGLHLEYGYLRLSGLAVSVMITPIAFPQSDYMWQFLGKHYCSIFSVCENIKKTIDTRYRRLNSLGDIPFFWSQADHPILVVNNL